MSQKRKKYKKLKIIIDFLLEREKLPVKYRDHCLMGNYKEGCQWNIDC
ncbi:type II toxin-antitoxin system YafQ family toxin [Rickettsiella massiliensis]